MPKKSTPGMKSLSRVMLAVALATISFSPAIANVDGIPTENRDLTLPDGRLVTLRRLSQHETRMTLESNSKGRRIVLWQRVFEQEFDRVWDRAFFVPVKPNRYVIDLDRNGSPEIAVATYDGGNNLFRYALLFSVRRRSLMYYGRSPKAIDLVMPTSIFPK